MMQVTRGPVECALVLTLVDGCPRIVELAGRTKEHLIGNTLKAAGKTGERLVVLSDPVAAYLRELSTHALFPAFGPHGNIIDRPAAGKTWYYIRARVGSGHDGGRNFESCRSCQTIVANLPFRWQGLGQGSPSTLK